MHWWNSSRKGREKDGTHLHCSVYFTEHLHYVLETVLRYTSSLDQKLVCGLRRERNTSSCWRIFFPHLKAWLISTLALTKLLC